VAAWLRLEFSHVYARAGAKVTVLEALPRLLQHLDQDAVGKLVGESERIGIALHTGVKVERIEAIGDRLRVVYQGGGAERFVEADRVVNGAGRIPNVDSLDLDAGKIAHDRERIIVDDYLRSKSNPAIYVAGDPLTSPQLSLSPATRAASSAAISSKDRDTSRTTPPFPHASLRCRRSPPLA
jgi:glutathione reductase (NADPH)